MCNNSRFVQIIRLFLKIIELAKRIPNGHTPMAHQQNENQMRVFTPPANKSRGEPTELTLTERYNLSKPDSKPRIALQKLRRVRVGNLNSTTSQNVQDMDGMNPAANDDTVSVTSSNKFRVTSSHSKRRSSTLHPKINEIGGQSNTQYGHLEKTYTRAELRDYHQLFKMFDTDNSGAIGNEELKEAISSIGIQASASDVHDLINEVDEDGNGEIDFEEFCQCMKKSQNRAKSTNEDIIKQCFEVFDQDGNGLITENEFVYIAKEIGGFSQELAEFVFSELDISSVGHISSDQFGAIVEDYLLSDNTRSSSS